MANPTLSTLTFPDNITYEIVDKWARSQIELIIEALLSEEIVENAFFNVFTNTGLDDRDPTAMTTAEINEAVSTKWSGESSEDETAMKADEINEAVSTEWSGESSEDETAMKADEINEVTI